MSLALLTGCGGDDGGDATPSQSPTELEITVWPSGRSGDKKEATLSCSPAGGTLDHPEDACRRLETMDRPFIRPAGPLVCTEIYGGPAVAEILGTFDGTEVNATFARSDGCEIALWDRHQFLFPAQPASP
ncbi:MAG TPA: SSI family serine proteinase inhibitor [Gaiellaceae bacterium]|jgi:hypothetical protein